MKKLNIISLQKKCSCSCSNSALASGPVSGTPSDKPSQARTPPTGSKWNIKYLIALTGLAAIWLLLYTSVEPLAEWLSREVLGALSGPLGLLPASHLTEALRFFIYDTGKILLLLIAMIYAIAWLRAGLNTEKVRDFLSAKHRAAGYLFGSGLGAITPFCSCSSIPLFLGFTAARIPLGVTMSFLITSPLINEVAIILLWGLLGWKFTLIYVAVGLLAGIAGGWFMDKIRAERGLQPFLRSALQDEPNTANIGQSNPADATPARLTLRQRHFFALSETTTIVKRIWLWVIIGVGAGAALHGYVPEDFFASHFGGNDFWSVPLAVLTGIPLYSNVTGIVPVMESLLAKGLPIGTTLAFCMSTVAVSLPEVLMLKQVMQWKLLAVFIGCALVIFTLAGWLFNLLGPYVLQ